MHIANLQTKVALQVSELAEQFRKVLSGVRVQPGDYSPELTAPEGPSTGNGAQALQHVRLVPGPGHAGLPTIVAGHANRVVRTAELRTYAHVDRNHRERFGTPLPLDREQYDRFLEMAKNFFDGAQLKTTIADPPAPDVPSIAPPALRRRGLTIGLVAGGILAVIVVIAILAMKR
ncbi:MAG: hypothetical protein ACLQVI_21030 [Polyangiaceae bacterium]|jgi:hypothetical protein